jgi:hypothetical protein
VNLSKKVSSTLLFNHSSRLYYLGALAGQRCGLKFDAELLYAGKCCGSVQKGATALAAVAPLIFSAAETGESP